MPPQTPRETFWATISYAWRLVDDGGARRVLLRSPDSYAVRDAAARLTARMPLMLSTLVHMLDTYTSPQLLAWSRECKSAVAELLRPSLHRALAARDDLQVMFNAAWIVAAGERVRAAVFADPIAFRELRGRVGCVRLLAIAWGMHREKFGPLQAVLSRRRQEAEAALKAAVKAKVEAEKRYAGEALNPISGHAHDPPYPQDSAARDLHPPQKAVASATLGNTPVIVVHSYLHEAGPEPPVALAATTVTLAIEHDACSTMACGGCEEI